jgi:hypothetical protein
MAWVPCDRCKKRYTGKASYTYGAVVEQGERVQIKERLCPDCFASWERQLEHFADVIDGTAESPEWSDRPTCGMCGQELQRRLAFFATSFGQGGERTDWFATVCAQCASLLSLSPNW